jgi:hypothetical protein
VGYTRGEDKFFENTRQTGEYLRNFTRQVKKQLAKNIEKD